MEVDGNQREPGQVIVSKNGIQVLHRESSVTSWYSRQMQTLLYPGMFIREIFNNRASEGNELIIG